MGVLASSFNLPKRPLKVTSGHTREATGMVHRTETMTAAGSTNTIPRRTWTKPEAKAAEVAKATLGNGGPNTSKADILQCAS